MLFLPCMWPMGRAYRLKKTNIIIVIIIVYTKNTMHWSMDAFRIVILIFVLLPLSSGISEQIENQTTTSQFIWSPIHFSSVYNNISEASWLITI